MNNTRVLTQAEAQWLLAIVRGPLRKSAAERSMPEQVRESLLDKGFIRWKVGFVEITPKGSVEAGRVRSAVMNR